MRASMLRIPIEVVGEALEKMKEGPEKEEIARAHRLTSLRRFVEFQPTMLTKAQVGALWKAAKTRKGEASWKQELEFMFQAARDPSKMLVKSVRDFTALFKAYLAEGFIKGWLFERAEHGAVTPCLVTNINWYPSDRYRSEYVQVTMLYTQVDGEEHASNINLSFGTLISTYKAMNQEAAEARAKALEEAEAELSEAEAEEDEDGAEESSKVERRAREKALRAKLKSLTELPDGVPMDRILSHLGYYKETTELHAAYDKQTDRFMKLIRLYGSQLRVRGTGVQVGDEEGGNGWSWRRWGDDSMLVDGRPSRAIMDTRPLQNFEEESYGKRRKKKANAEEEGEEAFVDIESLTKDDFFPGKAASDCKAFEAKLATNDLFTIPLHLSVKIFHLEKHRFYKVHVVNLVPYKYKPEMADMLILPTKVSRVANMLMAGEGDEAEDIVEGKSQGRMLTCIGDPGLGKTLLAEVLSEKVGKPLYKIQAAQLGLDPETLEQKLRTLLHRAERWGCVLMIDEANAYIHDRGIDVTQNAIVGVFLRLLEYFRGTIILTTNQTNADGTDMDVDDAILSRSYAVVHFKLPTDEEALEMWKVQKKLLKAEISEETIAKAVKHFRYSGRSIRQLLRLAWDCARYDKKDKINFEMLKEAAEFIPISRTERRAMEKGKLVGVASPSEEAKALTS
jgi:SpoVK/Ycf46/Vps4 family AAA+-type ATPase